MQGAIRHYPLPGVLTTIPEKVVVEVSREVFRKMVYRESSDGVVALAKPKEHKLGDLRLGSNPFVIILEAVEKPGNLGAVLRTADAAGVNAVVVCDPRTDLYNPNVVRSSVGTLFTRADRSMHVGRGAGVAPKRTVLPHTRPSCKQPSGTKMLISPVPPLS